MLARKTVSLKSTVTTLDTPSFPQLTTANPKSSIFSSPRMKSTVMNQKALQVIKSAKPALK